MRMLAVLGISLLLLVGLVSPISAGWDPTLFKANQLDAVTNQLNAIDAKINAVLVHPPENPMPDDVATALTNVWDGAQAIVKLADGYLNSGPIGS